MDSPCLPTVNQILSDISKFRILVVGKSGSGKSELLSRVFGIDTSPQNEDSVQRLGDTSNPKIDGGLVFRENSRLLLYTSSGDFLPNSDADFNEIRSFISERVCVEDLQERLHAVWICMDTPLRGERLQESGIERVLEVANKKIPIIIVLTKFDELVNSIRSTEKTSDSDGDDEDSEALREEAERLLDNTLKKVSLDSFLSQQLVTPVSTMPGYEDTISTLIQSTDGAIQRSQGRRTHELPVALAWAVAQRQDVETTVAATIDVGKMRHWNGLSSSTDFKGTTLEHCVSIIQEDIIAIWNVQDGSGYLGRGDFKARMSHLVEDLAYVNQNVTIPCSHCHSTTSAAAAAASSPISVIGADAEAAKWVSDVYLTTPNNIACIMGYIVDLIMVLTFLSEMHQLPEIVPHWHRIEEDAVNAIKACNSSGLLSAAHEDIRKFIAANQFRQMTDGEDVVQREIVRLVRKFHTRAKDSVKKVSQKKLSSPTISVASVPEDSFEQLVRAESVRLRYSSVTSRGMPRRSIQEPSPDILTIVEEATKIPISRSSSEGTQRPTLLVPEPSPSQGPAPSPLNPLNWIRRDHHHVADMEAGKS